MTSTFEIYSIDFTYRTLVPAAIGPPEQPKPAIEDKCPNKPLGFALQNIDSKHAYLSERGLTQATVDTFGLGFCAKGVMAGRIIIPIHNAQGELVAYVGRWPGNPSEDKPKYKLPNGFKKSQELFNFHRAIIDHNPEMPIVVVEGFFDCIKLWQAGIQQVVAIMGSSLSEAQAVLIGEAVSSNGKVILMFDMDEAGRIGQEEALLRLSRKVFVQTISLSPERHQPDQLSNMEILELLK
jgi:DNA primase